MLKFLPLIALMVLLLAALVGCEQPASDNGYQGDTYSWEVSGRHVLAFSMEGCRQCRADKAELRRLEDSGVDVIYLTREKNPELVEKYGVEAYPTYIALEDGEIKSRSLSLTALYIFLQAAVWILGMLI